MIDTKFSFVLWTVSCVQQKLLLVVTILFLIGSCEEDKPDSDNSLSKTSFDIGSLHYESFTTTSYQTDFGQILEVTGTNFELNIVLTDTINTIYSVTDTLTGTDYGKAKCILKLNNDFKFSTSGTIEYDLNNKSGTFTIEMEELKLTNGQINVDTIITKAIIDFTSLTETDYQGVPMNGGDYNDWIIRTNFDIVERIIFNLKDKNLLSSTIQLIEYPNPFNDIIQLHLDIPLKSKADIFLVNTNFEIEKKFIGLQPGRVALWLDSPGFKGNYYRLYYKFYTDSDHFYGSGDLKAEI